MNKILSMVGMAMKAGKVVSGEFSTEKAVKTGKAFLVIVSEAASDNTKKCFATCAPTMKCQCMFMEPRKTWDIPWEKNFVPPLQLRRKDLRNLSKKD